MIELLILACVAVVGLVALLIWESRAHGKAVGTLLAEQMAERSAWRDERRFLIDRAIARHVGEVVALEREDARKNMDVSVSDDPRVPRPLLEGLS